MKKRVLYEEHRYCNPKRSHRYLRLSIWLYSCFSSLQLRKLSDFLVVDSQKTTRWKWQKHDAAQYPISLQSKTLIIKFDKKRVKSQKFCRLYVLKWQKDNFSLKLYWFYFHVNSALILVANQIHCKIKAQGIWEVFLKISNLWST